MIAIQESLIISPTINANGELIVKLRIKQQDFTMEQFEELRNLKDTGTPCALVLKEFQKEIDDQLMEPSLRAKLAYFMRLYANKEDMSEEDLVNSLYKKYSITSRAQLTEEQLIECIKTYEAGLQYE